MELEKILNEFLADLNVFYRKLQNYHWNIQGKDFFQVHSKLEELYNEINEQVDEIAEHILILGGQPLGTLKDYMEISKIKEKLGIKLFSKIFRIVLTDNGTEFFNPKNIEFDLSSGNKTCNVFYCKPYSSWQKGCIEKNHEYIRKIFPKGTSFDSFSEEQIHKLENIINNIPRQSLDNKTPFELTNQLYPNFISKLNYHKINPDDVSLNPKDF